MYSNIKLVIKKVYKKAIISLVFLFGFLLVFSPVYSVTLLTDDFAGTTINVSKWTETDAGGIGGTSGNIQQNGNLSMTGSGGWGANYLLTASTFDRTTGNLDLDADVTCVSSASIPGIGYGDPGVLTGGGQSYTMYVVSNTVYFSRQNANVNSENIDTLFSCTNNVSFHIKITVDQTTGASLFINGSGTPAATLTGGTFNNKGFFLEGHSGTTLVDNVTISGASAATVPDAPTSLTATPSNTQMALSWTAPVNNGGAAITDYLVEYKLATEPTTWTTFNDGVSTSTSALVTSLTNGLSYNFRVSAINIAGTGAASGTATATPALSVPSAPRTLVATGSENGQSTLTWLVPLSNGGAAITDYKVEYKLATEPTTWNIFPDGVSTNLTATVTGLTNSLNYDFRVSAINSVGTSAASNTASATPVSATLSDSFTGTTIDTNKWTEVDSGGLGGTSGKVQQSGTLNITPNAGAWSSQDGIKSVRTFDRTNGDVSIEFSVTRDNCGTGVGTMAMGYGDLDFTTVPSASYILLSNTTNWELYYWLGGSNQALSPQTLSGLSSCTNGVPTTFKLVALQAGGAKVYVNGSGTAAATITTGTFTNKQFWFGGYQSGGTVSYDNVVVTEPVTGPFEPVNLITTPGSTQMGLSWTAGDSNGSPITDYIIEYKPTANVSWSTFNDGTSTNTSTTVTGLTNGLSYSFRVSAVNANGTSDSSAVIIAMPITSDWVVVGFRPPTTTVSASSTQESVIPMMRQQMSS